MSQWFPFDSREPDQRKSQKQEPKSGINPCSRQRHFEPALYHVNDYIRSNIANRIKIEDLARAAKLNVFQLIRTFHREYATTPYAFVLQTRIEHAKTLLRRGINIADVAIDTGFSDQSHLTRHFKRLEGTTPKSFQSNHKA